MTRVQNSAAEVGSVASGWPIAATSTSLHSWASAQTWSNQVVPISVFEPIGSPQLRGIGQANNSPAF